MTKQKRKSHAEKAVLALSSDKKNKKQKNSANTGTSKAPASSEKHNTFQLPARLISSLCFIGLFILFLVIYFGSEGAIIKLIDGIIHGLIGRVGFIMSIPVLLYLFYIHAFSGKRPIKMRTVCLVLFVLISGCIAHLALNYQSSSNFINYIVELYTGGIDGITSGVICGLLSTLFHWLFGTFVSYIILIIFAIITLLGGMQITVPSIIRAIQNRPRVHAKDEVVEEKQEPASVVVNHIVNKRIEYIERKKKAAIIDSPQDDITEEEAGILRPNHQLDTNTASSISVSNSNHTKPASTAFMKTVSDLVPDKMPELELDATADNDASYNNPDAVLAVKKEKVTTKDAERSAAEVAAEIAQAEAADKPVYCFPPIDLLSYPGRNTADGTAEMKENSKRLNETLASFKIEAHIINVTRGPSVTRYEVELEKGVRLSKLTTAADDIALSLGATGVRIAAVPGKISVVGIEVPNRAVTTVSLREVIDSHEFKKAKSKSSFAVGKDISGNSIVGNIARLPHMLIAGTTGSGKSVCMNSIIISLLYKASPEDVKLIMVDPKMVELGIYNGIPHLLIPVVTDPKKAAGSLQWAVSEMMRRYKAMSDAGVRDLESYNSIAESQDAGYTKLPQVVVIIDELADLMLVAAKEVEESICRIAQMGRAAGIHLIIATQRPSADVITGLMKANIPSRIAFAVASAMESRIILDTQGAEKLVGKGDMLYAPIGNGKPKRVQGCFVTDAEVESVASYVKANYVTNYDQHVMEEIEKKALQTGTKTSVTDSEPNHDELSGDEMLPAAVDVILETGQASVSMLQRRLKLGYARAARIVDEMEEKGIVGPYAGSKPREILITKEQWQAMLSSGTQQLSMDDIPEEYAGEYPIDETL